MIDYEKIEEEIIKEKPYNWKKHFLFDLPDMLYFLIKITLIYVGLHIAMWALASALIEKLPTFCGLIK